MMTVVLETWQQANKQYLQTHLGRIKNLLKQPDGIKGTSAEGPATLAETELPDSTHDGPAALDMLCEWFHLSAFERDILLLCVGIELDREFASLCAAAQGNPLWNYPTFSLALSLFPSAHWSALSPDGALRRWHLIEIEGGHIMTLSPLRIDERILHYLLGVSYLDKQLANMLLPLSLRGPIVSSQQKIAHEIANLWLLAAQGETVPVIQLCGLEVISQQNIAVAACSLVNHNVYQVSASLLPAQPGELEHMLQLWERESILGNNALFLDCHLVEDNDTLRKSIVERIITANKSLLIIATSERHLFSEHLPLTFDVEKPVADEQRALWQAVLGNHAQDLHSDIDKLSSHFRFSSHTIATLWTATQARLALHDAAPSSEPQTMSDILWKVCRIQARTGLDDLAQRIEPVATWDDLVIADDQRSILRDIAVHVRQRSQVYDAWGFRGTGERGLGISALFAGTSGVGKTMAAEVLANDLRLDLYRVDLSAVVSKYIGETEKNLRRVFDTAEESGAILLFDEADALFGKRSEVKDSHDRYANIEVSYLLQRMEMYQGLAILTTNMKSALDHAFLRRIRFVVQFPFPDVLQRAAIWRKVFPAATPTQDLDVKKLAQLNAAGGNIRNIALYAAFLAADCRESVRMCHILYAARHEYAKLEKSLTSAEIRGWDETSTN
jgi:hypothetical protein